MSELRSIVRHPTGVRELLGGMLRKHKHIRIGVRIVAGDQKRTQKENPHHSVMQLLLSSYFIKANSARYFVSPRVYTEPSKIKHAH